jgi:hypothetical protein
MEKSATRADLDHIKADRTGLEPATSAVTGRHSNQLNYRSIGFFGTAKITSQTLAAKSF